MTGATGFVGRGIIPALLDAGHSVRALARGVRDGTLPGEVDVVRGSVADRAQVRVVAEGMDACVHLVAVIVPRAEQTFENVNVLGTQNLVSACAEAGVRRFVHLSALGAAPDDRFPYLRSKWQGEEAVRGSSMDWTVLRPSALFGPEAGFFRPIVWTLRWMPVYPLPKGGRTRFQPLAVEDLAACVVRALDGACMGESVDLGGPDVMDFRAIVEVVMEALGRRRRLVSIPLFAARPFAFMQGLRREPLVTNQQLDMVVLDNTCDLDSAARAFGVTPRRMRETDLRWLARL